jgi:gliding motility-associated-like protein
VIYGKTAESYGSQWYASQAPLCSNECEIEVTAYARYGVAPYTFTHPWSTDTIVTGTNTGCGAGATNHHFFLTIPNCPTYCDSTETLLNIPPPVVTDACGTLIAGIPIETVPIKPATNIVLQYDSILCSGENINVSLASCFSNGTAYYWGEGLSGQGSFSANASTNGLPVVLLFNAYAAGDGCVSDTTQFTLSIYSNPIANYTINPSPIIVGMQGDFSDASVSPAASISQWTWTVDDTLTSLSTQWSNVYQTPGNHTLCLFIQDTMGCVDTLCGPFSLVPATVNAPNVVTPNGDSKNDLLAFQYLEFYEKNKLQIFNRWGNLIYEKENYLNDWNGSEVKDGTYFYTLDITDKKETLSGFFYLIK